MTRIAPSLLLVLAAFAGGLLSRPALADFYECRSGGRVWLTNRPASGGRCRVVMKSRAPRTTRGASARSVGGARPGPAFSPPPAGSGIEAGDPRIDAIVRAGAERYALPLAFVRAVVKVESNFHPRATSRVGAMGLMQLMPGTAASLGVQDPYDPQDNVMGGCKLLRMLANRFEGDLVRTLAAYHAGRGAVEAKEGVPYARTDQYVRMVLDQYYRFKGAVAR